VAELTAEARPSRLRRALLWGALLALLGVAQTLLVALTIGYESVRAQDEVDAVATEAAADVRHEMLGIIQTLQALAWSPTPQPGWRVGAEALLKARPGFKRVEWRDQNLAVVEAMDTPFLPRLFAQMPRGDLSVEAEVACNAARRAAAPMFSRSYFVPQAGALGLEVMDLCIPEQRAGREAGFLVGTIALSPLLEAALPVRQARRHEFSFVEADGTRLARAGVRRGASVYLADRMVVLPGATLQLRADSAENRPSLIPNLATALVLGLSFALFGVVLLLARDVRRRAQAERALAEALAFRKAMEDSLSTGLRARDMQGVITYVNPAFCAMVGFAAEELLAEPADAAAGKPPIYAPPYWPPEFTGVYQERQQRRLEGEDRSARELREGFETVFMRKNGERFPVMIYEAPLVDGQGRQNGWMSAVLDLSAQRKVEEISRQQQDRLQATARLATVGEMASLLSHELNQPLAAIASYASGSLNLIDDPQPAPDTPGLIRQALERIAEQAERAGRVIKSVHDFVRRREQLHETLSAELLLEAVLPLARMQARKSGTRIELDLPAVVGMGTGVSRPLRVRCDRTMVEQVLLNLARNGIQAMEGATPLADRVLTLRVRQTQPGRVTFSVIDLGPGITPEVSARLFTPFFTTRSEGMGLGLSLCRTVIEQHGGTLDFTPGPKGRGTEFRFTLPAPATAENAETPRSSIAA
jgi:two-component system sensor histidine kinase DctS